MPTLTLSQPCYDELYSECARQQSTETQPPPTETVPPPTGETTPPPATGNHPVFPASVPINARTRAFGIKDFGWDVGTLRPTKL
jgi:hypothetical protein